MITVAYFITVRCHVQHDTISRPVSVCVRLSVPLSATLVYARGHIVPKGHCTCQLLYIWPTGN